MTGRVSSFRKFMQEAKEEAIEEKSVIIRLDWGISGAAISVFRYLIRSTKAYGSSRKTADPLLQSASASITQQAASIILP